MSSNFRTLLLPACLVMLVGAPLVLGADKSPHDADLETLRAVHLGTDGPALLDFFRGRTLTDSDRSQVLALIHDLGDDAFEVRERATDALVQLGARSVPLLRQATRDGDIEVVRRSEYCLRLIDRVAGPAVTAAAARLLAQQKPAGATEVLLAFVPFADDENVVDEVRTALTSVGVHDGKSDPRLLDALHDKLGARRAVAGEALARSNSADLRRAVHPLLADPDPQVRLRVGLALIEARDKTAVGPLIALLGELPREDCWPIEDVLYRIAGDQAPRDLLLGADDASRKKYRDGWKAWWEHHADRVDLAKLDLAERALGYTLLVEMDMRGVNGKVVELGTDKKPRWSIEGLQQPMDAWIIGKDRVLITEFRGMRVTERNFKGEVLWEKRLAANANPIAAQRLINGNTFIACRNQLLEFDRAGNEVMRYDRNAMDIVMAQRLRNGQIAMVTQQGMFIRTDATGKKQLATFPVGQNQMFGGNFEVLANDHVLTALYANSRVVEYDRDGKPVWEAQTNLPTCLQRLPNGNTLVGSMYNQQVVELDKNGKQVWDYRSDGRLYRVRRR